MKDRYADIENNLALVLQDMHHKNLQNDSKLHKFDIKSLKIPEWRYWWLWLLDELPPHNVNEVDVTPDALHCYSYVYRDCVCLDTLPQWFVWQLRYFTIDENGFHSVTMKPDEHSGAHTELVEIMDISNATNVRIVNADKLIFSIGFDKEGFVSGIPAIKFRATSATIMEFMVERLRALIDAYAEMSDERKMEKTTAAQYVVVLICYYVMCNDFLV